MELENHKIVPDFITEAERDEILNAIDEFNYEQNIKNKHIKCVAEQLKGNAMMFDISQTHISNYLASFQSGGNVLSFNSLTPIFKNILSRIESKTNYPTTDSFLQIIDMEKGGKIAAHYDTSYKNRITYKCNISVLSEDYDLFIGNNTLAVKERDLYCFEASLFKHWTLPFQSRRVLLSYGFSLPLNLLNRSENDPRVRMSNRIFKYFQN